mmetsp:Transcript_41997/g.115924  ORF Transcript_41997/g.115924 Transcript_41997/m.115924 type:complete len:96 (+) Transcript_41997:1998-2285(+)
MAMSQARIPQDSSAWTTNRDDQLVEAGGSLGMSSMFNNGYVTILQNLGVALKLLLRAGLCGGDGKQHSERSRSPKKLLEKRLLRFPAPPSLTSAL